MRLFALALAMQEAADNGVMSTNQTGVGGEDHIGRTRVGRDDVDGGMTGKDCMEALPLFGGQGGAGTVDVSFHPRVDDVIDLVELGWTHQVAFVQFHRKDGSDINSSRTGRNAPTEMSSWRSRNGNDRSQF